MRIDAMELVGVAVSDLDEAVARYSTIFGIEFRVFTAGLDYELIDEDPLSAGATPELGLPDHVRLAMDTSGMFELIEIPGVREGFRNVHFRVDDIEATAAHFQAAGLRLVACLRAGNVREFIFDGAGLNGIRACLVEYEGSSFAAALETSPQPVPSGPRHRDARDNQASARVDKQTLGQETP